MDYPHEFRYLAELSAALDDPGDDLQTILEVLTDDLVTAVPSFLGLRITLVPGEDTARDTTGVTLDLLPAALRGAVRTSLLVPLNAPGGAGGSIVFYAGRAGAFVDLAADTRAACHLTEQVALDQHLPSAGMIGPSGVSGPTEAGVINRAIGVLIGRGRTPEEARRVLRRRADRDGCALHRVAQELLDRQAMRRRLPVEGPTLEDDIPLSSVGFACRSIIPGCRAVFTAVSDQGVLDQVLAHAITVHGMADPGLPFIELVMTHTRPVSPDRHRPRSTGRPWADDGTHRRPAGMLPSNVYPLRPPNRPAGPGFGLGRAHETYRHECVFYAGTDGFLNAMLPFVRDGLARLEPVLVAVAEPRLQALRSALGDDAEDVIFADMAQLGHNPALIIPAWRDFTDRHGGPGRPVRGIGEPIWAGRRPAEIQEAQFHEALLNVAVSPDTPLWLLCPYDTAALDHEVLAEAQRSHPVLVQSNTHRASTRYGGARHAQRFLGHPLPPPQSPSTMIPFDPRNHRHVQATLDAATSAGLPAHRATRLAVAVDELAHATNQDPAHVTIRLWPDLTSMIGEITDPGTVHDPMIGRGPGPGPFPPREHAIRLAHELCDLVQIRSGPTGTTTRIHTRR